MNIKQKYRALTTYLTPVNVLSAMAFALSLTAPLPSAAQTTSSDELMIVFDASGSMWGQIDGVTKIEIARDAFAEISTGWSQSGQSAGLIAYGHRRKGDCSDIEILSTPSPQAARSMAKQVMDLSPKGKTPLSASVRLAAETLKFTENAATVVLLSDGRETCDADPCALGAELEKLGVDFTAHVVGFGLTEEADKSELRCLAEATGGQYIDAENADTLTTALRQATAPTPQPQELPEPVQSAAINLSISPQNGAVHPEQVSISATNLATGEKRTLGALAGTQQVLTGLAVDLALGTYLFELTSSEGTGRLQADVVKDYSTFYIPFSANDVAFELEHHGPYFLNVEHLFLVHTNTPLQEDSTYTIAIARKDAREYTDLISTTYHFGNTPLGISQHSLAAPDSPGDYDLIIYTDNQIADPAARFDVTFIKGDTPTWDGARSGAPGELLPLGLKGYYNWLTRLTLLQRGEEISNQNIEAMATPDGFFLKLPNQPGVYEAQVSFAKVTYGKSYTQSLGEFTVIDPNAQVQEDASGAPETTPGDIYPDYITPADILHRCDTARCSVDLPEIDAFNIPLRDGFAIAFADQTETGRPSFVALNLGTGEVIEINPILQAMNRTCINFSGDGYRDVVDGWITDHLCRYDDLTPASSDMLDIFGVWISDRNGEIFSAELDASEFEDTSTMADDVPHSVAGHWIVQGKTDKTSIGQLVFPDHEAGAPELTFQMVTANYEKLGPFAATIITGHAQMTWDDDLNLTRVTLRITDDGDELRLALARPKDWDQSSEVWGGIAVLFSTKASIAVEYVRKDTN